MLVVGGIVAWWMSQNPTDVYRFRLVVEVEVDGAVRSGSSVIEVRVTHQTVGLPESKGWRSRISGEAVFVDLGGGRNVIALLASGPNAENVDFPSQIVPEHFGPSYSQDLSKFSSQKGQWDLSGRTLPTFVTFIDVNDPRTARVVRPEGFERVLGQGVSYKRTYVEIVSPGTWPFNELGWPQTLIDEPVTRGIEGELPWLIRMKTEGLSGRIETSPGQFIVNVPYFTR